MINARLLTPQPFSKETRVNFSRFVNLQKFIKNGNEQ